MDHTRVVHLLRKADNLPLVKDYLLSVQKSNLAAVNEAVNELLVEEDNFEVPPWPPQLHLHCTCTTSLERPSPQPAARRLHLHLTIS